MDWRTQEWLEGRVKDAKNELKEALAEIIGQEQAAKIIPKLDAFIDVKIEAASWFKDYRQSDDDAK